MARGLMPSLGPGTRHGQMRRRLWAASSPSNGAPSAGRSNLTPRRERTCRKFIAFRGPTARWPRAFCPLREIKRGSDLARGHCPDFASPKVGGNQGVDGFGDLEAGAVADGAASRMPPSAFNLTRTDPRDVSRLSLNRRHRGHGETGEPK